MEFRTIYRSVISLIGIGVFILITSGCIEHHYSYKVNMDGGVDFTYQARGDSVDIYNPHGSFPEDPFYKTKVWTEYDSNGAPTYVLEAQAHYTNGKPPATIGLREVPWGEILLHHPVTISRNPYFFFNLYRYAQTFIGRRSTDLEGDRWRYIPEECKVLETGGDSLLSDTERAVLEEKYAAGMLIWNAERYKMRVRQILERTLRQHPEYRIPQEWVDSSLAATDSMIYAYSLAAQLDSKTKSLDQVNLEWWGAISEPLLDEILKNLNTIGDTTLPGELLRISELLELRHQVSEDLLDESYEIRVDLPGRILKSNSNVMDKGVLVWKIFGQDLQEADVTLKASSLYLFPARIVGFLVLLAAIYLAIRLPRKKREQTVSAPPPPPPRDARG
jgi:hypothetical protein